MKLSRLTFSLLTAAALALVLAWLDKGPDTGRDWLAYFLVTLIGGAMVYGVWLAVGRERLTAPITAAGVRLAVGVALMLLLPVVGYATSEEHQSGYFYWDAQKRDFQSWGVAQSGAPLVAEAFSGKHWGDQYGGMLLLSAFTYRTFSPDVHRPFLILILNAAAAACGVLFIGYAARRWFGASVAGKTAWITALYPEAVLLGGTHMREAYLLPLLAMMLFGLARLQEKRRDGWAWLLAASGLLTVFSSLSLVAGLLALAALWLLDPDQLQHWRILWKSATFKPWIMIVGVLAGLLLLWGAFSGLNWIQNNIAYQSYLSERASGIVQNLQRWVGPQWAWLVTLVYGVAQPVLPAVVGDLDAAWIMRLVGFFRAAGWYGLAFFLSYGLVILWRTRSEPRRAQLIGLTLLLWAWIAFTALYGGGDQWDNPRYRIFLLPWMALLAAWAWQGAVALRDRWFWRWLGMEAFFVASFTVWYLDRYYIKTIRLGIREMILINSLAAVVILGSGWMKRKAKGSL